MKKDKERTTAHQELDVLEVERTEERESESLLFEEPYDDRVYGDIREEILDMKRHSMM